MTSSPNRQVLREVVLDQLTTGEIHAYRMWLPPLTDPTPVNELVARDYDRRPLRFGLGIMDEPRRHRQEVWGIDVSAAAATSPSAAPRRQASRRSCRRCILSAAASHTPTPGAVLLRRHRRWRPDVPRGSAARRRRRDPF